MAEKRGQNATVKEKQIQAPGQSRERVDVGSNRSVKNYPQTESTRRGSGIQVSRSREQSRKNR